MCNSSDGDFKVFSLPHQFMARLMAFILRSPRETMKILWLFLQMDGGFSRASKTKISQHGYKQRHWELESSGFSASVVSPHHPIRRYIYNM